MSDSFQEEIPRSRVNIALDLETGGEKVKKELPLKLLVMGDFSNGQNDADIAERKRVKINSNNFSTVIKDISPKVNFSVDNKLSSDSNSDLNIKLSFDSFKAFQPEMVAAQVPELNNMLAMRNLLKDLKSNILDNASLRKELERILKNRPELDKLKVELNQIAPIDSDVAASSVDVEGAKDVAIGVQDSDDEQPNKA